MHVWETQYGIESVKSKRLLLSRLHSALNLPVLSTSFRQKKQQNSNNNNKNWKKGTTTPVASKQQTNYNKKQ